MQPVIYVDLRCLQDPAYRVRGIGHHVAALLRSRTRSSLGDYKAIGLIDPRSPKLPDECASWVDEVSAAINPCCDTAPSIFIDGTPMTHDTRFSFRFQSNPAFFRAAVVYDFIPLDWPGYLPTAASRMDYLAKLARLRTFDLLLPISEYTAWRATELLGIPRHKIGVTGASVRQSLYDIRQRFQTSGLRYGTEPYFVMVIAEDARKNPDVAVKAVRHLNLLYGKRIPLKVVGHNLEYLKTRLLSLAGHIEGNGFLEFCPDISDERLVSLYSNALATIVPSHIEGFSLPVVEASVCGCPVIASTCAAHLELIEQQEALFPSHDPSALCERLEAFVKDPPQRDRLVQGQAHLSRKFREDLVGERFWNAIADRVQKTGSTAIVTKGSKPRLAFLSPFPPDQSGVARYMAMTMQASRNLFHSDLYTNASRPLAAHNGFRDAGRISLAPLINGQYNAVISVLGNSHFHTPIFDIFERYGGPCILHDARLIQIYVHRLGHDGFLTLASRLLERSISMDEVVSWLQDRNPASLLLEPIIERAAPLIVHTKTQQAQIKTRYEAKAEVITCCPTVFFHDDELRESRKQSLRERYGISPGAFLVSSFGIVSPEKSLHTCIMAVELLRYWKIPAELYFVGNAKLHREEIERLAHSYGIAKHIHAEWDFVDDETYRDFLAASDAALQLRTYGFGQFSAALADCISAGLPCVATADLAASCDAPQYVATVPDQFSPLQIAEQLVRIWEAHSTRGDHVEERACYLETHNFQHYGNRLLEILGIA